MLMLSRGVHLPVMLMVVFGPLIGCNSVTGVGDPGSQASSDADGDEGPGAVDAPEPSDEGPGAIDAPEPSDEALPDFSVIDANAGSARYKEVVSPRDYLGQISAWYFGQST